MRKKKTEPEELLAAIAEAVDDGFCPASSLVPERRGPDSQVYLALTSEGWRTLRSSRTFSPSINQMRRPSG